MDDERLITQKLLEEEKLKSNDLAEVLSDC